jgi:hypothetical protein
MKTKHLLISLLSISMSINVFILMSSMNPSSDCPEINSYSNGAEISESDAQTYADTYKSRFPKSKSTGGIIAGNALENLFCTPGTNGLAYHLAIDPTGNIADGGVFLVLLGAKVILDNEGNITYSRRTGPQQFRTNNWCPPNCVAISE